MEYKDYYRILGVPKGASDKELKAAYRKLARKHHPDVNPGNKQAEARFKEINEAYEVLGDTAKRKRYDELGENWEQFGRGGPAAGGWPGGTRVEFEDLGGGGFSDFFRMFFSGGGSGGGAQGFGGFGPTEAPAPDVEGEVELTLAEVLSGTTRVVALEAAGGRRRVEVRIPPGVREGSRVRVAGEGGRTKGGRAGDLYLRVRVAPHAEFVRREDDIETRVPIPLTTAVLGGEAQVRTLEGSVGIKIPPHTAAGQVFRLRGQGLPRPGGKDGRGDLHATVVVELPKRLTPKQRELFEALRDSGA